MSRASSPACGAEVRFRSTTPRVPQRRWTERDLREEKGRLTNWLEVRKAQGLGVPAAKTRPNEPSTLVISREAKVRRSAISLQDGHLRGTLEDYVKDIGLQPFDEPGGLRPDHPERVTGDLVAYIESRKAAGLGLPSMNGRINFAAIARGAEIGEGTLTDQSHRNHKLAMDAFARMGGSTEDTKRSGPLVLAELLQELRADRRAIGPRSPSDVSKTPDGSVSG